jgi:hypothetical protein
VARLPVEDYTAGYQAMRDAMGKGKGHSKSTLGSRRGNLRQVIRPREAKPFYAGGARR